MYAYPLSSARSIKNMKFLRSFLSCIYNIYFLSPPQVQESVPESLWQGWNSSSSSQSFCRSLLFRRQREHRNLTSSQFSDLPRVQNHKNYSSLCAKKNMEKAPICIPLMLCNCVCCDCMVLLDTWRTVVTILASVISVIDCY